MKKPFPYQQRVIDEKAALDGSLQKLRDFLAGSALELVNADEKARLERQAGIMAQYSDVLGERIAAFK